MIEKFTDLSPTQKEINPDTLIQKLTLLIPQETNLNRTFIINISGASAAGKSTISATLSSEIPNCTVLNMDDYLRGWGIGLLNHDSGNPNKPYFARLNPNVYDLEKLYKDMIQLKDGKSIERPIFDELEKKPCGVRLFNPSKVLVLEGIYSLESPFLELGDISILIEASLHDRLLRKIVRNGTSYKENINDIIQNYLTNDEPTYPFYREEFRNKARFIVNNPLEPLRDFTSYPNLPLTRSLEAIHNLVPRTEHGTLHREEKIEIIEQNNQKLLRYTVGNKLLINDVILPDTHKLLTKYYEET